MNVQGKFGTKRLAGKLLAVFTAVALVASSFLLSAVWATADTTSPADTHYNVVMDADDVSYLAWKFADGSAGSVSTEAGHGYSGNAYKWHRGDGSVNASSIVDVSLNKSGYTDETAVVFYVDASAQIADNVNYTFMLNTITANGESCYKLTAGNSVFALTAEGDLLELSSGNQTIPIAKGFVGWYIIPFESFSRHWGVDESFASGSVTTLRLTTGTNWNSVLYLDDFGFATDAEAFLEAAIAGTLSANRPSAGGDEGDEGNEGDGGETGDPSSEGDYTVVMDFDSCTFTSNTNETYVTVESGSPLSGKYLKYNRGQNGVANANGEYSQIDFAATGKTDEEALVLYVKATHASSLTMYINDVDGETRRSLKTASNATFYTVAKDGTKTTLTSSSGNYKPGADFEGWVIVPFSSLTVDHWHSNTVVDGVNSGTVNGMYIGCAGAWGSVFSIDNVGFTADMGNFMAKAAAGTLVADIPSTGGDEGGEGGESGGDTPTEGYAYNIVMDFDTLTGSFSSIGDYTGTDTSVAVADGNGYAGKALHANRGTNGNGNGGGYNFEIDFTPTGDTTDDAFVFYLDSTLSTGITLGTVLGQPIRIYDKGGANGATRCFKLPVGAAYTFVSADGVATEKTVASKYSNSQIEVEIGTVGWYVIPFSSFEMQWGGVAGDTVDAGGVFRWATGNGGNWGNYYCFDNVGFAADAAAFAEAAATGNLASPGESGGDGGEGGDEPDQPGDEGDDPVIEGDFTAVMDFDHVSWTSNGNEVAASLKDTNGLNGTKGLFFDRGMSGGAAFAEIHFNPTGNTADEAYVLYVDGSALGGDFPLLTYFYDPGRCLKPTPGEAAFLVAEDGTKTETAITGSNGVTVPKGFKGWMIIPLSSVTTHHWTSDTEPKLVAGSVNGIYMGSTGAYGSTLNLDEFGFTADMDAFIEKAAAGTLSSNYGPVGTAGESGGDEGGGEGGGDEGGESGGDDDGVDTTVIAQDFEGTVEMPEDATGKYEIVDGDHGKALKIFRDTTPITIKSVPFNEIGTADHQYLAFWYDATGCAEKFYFGMIPRDADGNGITIASGHPVTTVVNGVVTKGDTKITSSNFSFRPATGTKGWMIIEINDQGEGDRIWKFDGGDSYTGTMENLASVELRLPEFHNSSIILDQFTLVDDLDAFIESIGGEEDDPYVPDLSNPSPSDYNLVVDFDEKDPTEIKHEGGGFAEESPAVSYEGDALWWDRGTDSAYSNTTAYISFNPTGYSDENALVFWWDGSKIASSHNVQILIYGADAATGDAVCMKVKSGAVYRTVKADGTVQDKVVAANGNIMCDKNYSGWIVIPYAALMNHWNSAEVTLKPGSVNQLMFQHGNTYGNVIFIDNIGFTHNVDNFAEKAAAGTLNEGGRVEPGPNVLPLPEGAGVSDKNLSGGADGATSDNDFFRTVVNFNSKVPLGLTEQNTYVKLVKEGVSGYGSAMNWFKNDNTLPSNLTFIMETGKEGETGIAFWISTKDSGNGFNTKIRLMPHDKKDGTERCWRLVQSAPFYLCQDGIIEEATIDTAQMLTVPGGFEGWVILPYDAFEHHWGVAKGDDDAAVSNYTIDPATVYVLDLYYGNQSVTKAIQIDEIGYFTDAEEFAKTMGVFPIKPVYDLPFQTMESTYGEGGVADGAGEGVLAWSDSKDTLLEINGDYSSDGYSLKVDTKGKAQVHICIDRGEEYGVLEPEKMNGFTGLAFWVYTEGAGTELAVSLKLSDGRTVKVDVDDLSTDFYRLVDESTFDTTAHAYKDGKVSIPADFQGWVVIDTCAYEAGDWNLSMLQEVVLDVTDESVMYLDIFRTGTSAVALLVNTMHFPMDDDLILSADAGKVVIEEQDDGTKVINLYQDGLTSGQFRDVAIVRAGYRVIYRDAQNRQLFGSVADMAKVTTVKVYLGSVEMAEYTLAVDGVIPGGNSPATGEQTTLWVYVLAAAMVGVITSLTVYRKAAEK